MEKEQLNAAREPGMTRKEIVALKHNFIEMAETLRLNLGAYSVKIEIETDCDKEQMCDIHINIG